MTERKPIRSEEELAEAFDQLFAGIPSPQTQAEIDEYIREAGIDPEEFGKHIRDLASEALRNSPLNWRNQHAQTEILKARTQLDKIEKVTKRDRNGLLDIIDRIIDKIKVKNPKLAPVHYRNQTELSEEDLASLLQELVFIAAQENIEIDLDE